MCGNIVYALCGFASPEGICRADICKVNLRVWAAGTDTETDILAKLFLSGYKTLLTQIKDTALDSIAQIVVKSGNAGNQGNVRLCGAHFFFKGAFPAGPSFAVHQKLRVDFIKARADCAHGINIMQSHQVKAESVNMVFLCPVCERINQKGANHRMFGSRFVATC